PHPDSCATYEKPVTMVSWDSIRRKHTEPLPNKISARQRCDLNTDRAGRLTSRTWPLEGRTQCRPQPSSPKAHPAYILAARGSIIHLQFIFGGVGFLSLYYQ